MKLTKLATVAATASMGLVLFAQANPATAAAAGPYACYWMSNVPPHLWVASPSPVADQAACKRLDSCSPDGGKQSRGGCYHWATADEVKVENAKKTAPPPAAPAPAPAPAPVVKPTPVPTPTPASIPPRVAPAVLPSTLPGAMPPRMPGGMAGADPRMPGGMSGADACSHPAGKSYYQERYDSCMKTDPRGTNYCVQWSGCAKLVETSTPPLAPVVKPAPVPTPTPASIPPRVAPAVLPSTLPGAMPPRMPGGMAGADACSHPAGKSYYQERYDSCMKTDPRGTNYCVEWSGCAKLVKTSTPLLPGAVPPRMPSGLGSAR